MDDGYGLGLLVGLIICMLIVVLCVLSAQRHKKNVEKIKAKLSKENLDILNNSTYSRYETNNNFVVGTSYIYEIIDEGNRFRIMLLYKEVPSNNFNIDSVYMTKENLNSKKLAVGMCVKTLHNTSVEAKFKVKEILET